MNIVTNVNVLFAFEFNVHAHWACRWKKNQIHDIQMNIGFTMKIVQTEQKQTE